MSVWPRRRAHFPKHRFLLFFSGPRVSVVLTACCTAQKVQNVRLAEAACTSLRTVFLNERAENAESPRDSQCPVRCPWSPGPPGVAHF